MNETEQASKEANDLLLLSQKIIFKTTPRQYLDLKIKFQYDDIKMSKFFRAMILAYLNDDPDLRKVVERLQINSKSINKQRHKETIEAEETKAKFGLNANEQENIFDLLEQEFPEL